MKNFIVSYERNEVFQAIIVKAESLDKAESFFKEYKPDAVLYGVTERTDISEEMRKGMPIVNAMKNTSEMMYRLAYAEERTACQNLGNDKERIEKRIAYFENHLKALKEILNNEDFR